MGACWVLANGTGDVMWAPAGGGEPPRDVRRLLLAEEGVGELRRLLSDRCWWAVGGEGGGGGEG